MIATGDIPGHILSGLSCGARIRRCGAGGNLIGLWRRNRRSQRIGFNFRKPSGRNWARHLGLRSWHIRYRTDLAGALQRHRVLPGKHILEYNIIGHRTSKYALIDVLKLDKQNSSKH